MDLVLRLKAFVTTAQTGSFTAAAEQMGVSNRLTSKYVAELESRLGVRLLQRTTRRVGLTPAGEDLLARAPALLDDLDDLLADVSEGSRAFSGVIRLSAPVTFGEIYVAGMLTRFTDENPDLTVDLRLDDKYVDLAAQGIDLAFRIGTTDTLSAKTRKLGEMQTYLVASPEYLDRAGIPGSPADLAGHALVLDSNRRNPRRWKMRKAGVEEIVHVEGRFHVNSARVASQLAAEGKGIAFAPGFAIYDALRSGRLKVLLEDYTGETVPISAVYLEGRRLPRKVRALIDYAAADIRSAGIL